MAVRAAVARVAGRWASKATVRVFAVVGAGARNRVEALHLRPDVRLVPTPRHATILLVAGGVPPEHQQRLDRLHDQLPHPRATLHWGADAPVPGLVDGVEAPGGTPERLDEQDDPVEALVRLQRRLLVGERRSDARRLPDRPPAPWRGLGDHGQGGEGMMGGRPYGRPMAMTDEDIRDGLALDRLTVTVGPFYPAFPPGLILRLSLQGDVVQEAVVLGEPLPQPASGALRRVARVLRVAGAGSLADRALGLAGSETGASPAVARLKRRLRRVGTLAALPPVELPGGGTVRSLMEDRLDRARREREADGPAAGSVTTTVDRGSDETTVAPEALTELLPGLEWGDAMLVVASLPLAPAPTAAGS